MGEMQRSLEMILEQVGRVTHGMVPFPTITDITKTGMDCDIDKVYRALDGKLPTLPINLRKWDMEFEGSAVELDEYLHFNRYRAATLRSKLYSKLPGFPLDVYRRHCEEHEDRCLTAGGYGRKWTNTACERQFGSGAPPGNLGGGGAPRWKQRAFYDFVKDLSPLLIGVRLARVSVWDELPDGEGHLTVVDILSRPSRTGVQALAKLIRKRGS